MATLISVVDFVVIMFMGYAHRRRARRDNSSYHIRIQAALHERQPNEEVYVIPPSTVKVIDICGWTPRIVGPD
jgi:hypothetical protein